MLQFDRSASVITSLGLFAVPIKRNPKLSVGKELVFIEMNNRNGNVEVRKASVMEFSKSGIKLTSECSMGAFFDPNTFKLIGLSTMEIIEDDYRYRSTREKSVSSYDQVILVQSCIDLLESLPRSHRFVFRSSPIVPYDHDSVLPFPKEMFVLPFTVTSLSLFSALALGLPRDYYDKLSVKWKISNGNISAPLLLLVRDIFPRSCAFGSLKRNDLILSVNQQSLVTELELIKLIRHSSKLSLLVLRNKEEVLMTIPTISLHDFTAYLHFIGRR